jgi:hypothetical protein
VTYIPVPSITLAPAEAVTSLPTAAIFPLRIRIDPFSIVPVGRSHDRRILDQDLPAILRPGGAAERCHEQDTELD